jgi:hypothetical protein
MQFRIYGVLLIAAGLALIWVFRPRPDNSMRCPRAIEPYLAILVTFLIGMGMPLLFFGSPGVMGVQAAP